MRAFAKISDNSANIELVDVAVPEVGDNELLVKIHAIGVGVHDEYFLSPHASYPYVVGIEAAGTVEGIGSGAESYKVGDRVAFVSAMQPKGGTWAEYAVVSVDSLVMPIPEAMSFEEAAAMPVAGNTVLKAFHAVGLPKGSSLFIAGGSGAIGSLAIQIAVARGYRVAASASARNHEYMKGLGADLVVDYSDSNWQQLVKGWQPNGVDGAIATQPGTAADSEPIVRDGGVIAPVPGDNFSPERGIELRHLPHGADVRQDLIDLIHQVSVGKVKLTIEKTYPFTDALLAFEKVKTRRARGKVVISLAPLATS